VGNGGEGREYGKGIREGKRGKGSEGREAGEGKRVKWRVGSARERGKGREGSILKKVN